ncbi:MAG TPA: protein-glutamate O-methyltransferase CheR [Actinomycetales bacterium]|nr:protein-glutamate O-methyltransferase CheR [Actinomycetales bacterium]
MTIAAETFCFVRDLVRRESAIVLSQGKEYLVESRLLPVAREEGLADIEKLVEKVRQHPHSPVSRRLVEALTTNETSWFRDGDPFAALRDTVVPDLASSRRTTRRLRIWSAACSSGQEAYSIAMTLLDTPAVAGWTIEILGTDLSSVMVQRAREGRYSQLEVNRGLPASHLVRHFERDGAGWRVNTQLRSMARFSELNLMRPFPTVGRFDVVFLRNVLIYFDVVTKRDILHRVGRVLAPDGYLYLGAAEMTMGVDDAWERVAAGRSSVYRRRKDAS